jgi:hypothetical protein
VGGPPGPAVLYGPRWQPTFDVLDAAKRPLRLTGLLEGAAAAETALGLALERATTAGTRAEAEMAQIAAAVDAPGDPADRDVGVLREDLVRAAGTSDALIAANADSARRMTHTCSRPRVAPPPPR